MNVKTGKAIEKSNSVPPEYSLDKQSSLHACKQEAS